MVSTLVGSRRFLAGVTRRPDRLKSLSLLLLATGTAMTTLVRWASRGSCSWCTLHQESRSAAVGGGGQRLVHQALLLEVVQGGGGAMAASLATQVTLLANLEGHNASPKVCLGTFLGLLHRLGTRLGLAILAATSLGLARLSKWPHRCTVLPIFLSCSHLKFDTTCLMVQQIIR